MYVVDLDGDDDVFFKFKGMGPKTRLRVLTNDVVELLKDVTEVHARYESKNFAAEDLRDIIAQTVKEFSKPRKPQRFNLGGNWCISVTITEPDIPVVMY